jgi:hypothetical protein
MTLKLKSLLVEQPANPAPAILTQIIQAQQAVFESAIQKLQSIDYSALSDDAVTMLRDNAKALCEAYVEYCDNTLGTIKQYPTESADRLISENVYTMIERIENGLTY